GDGVNRKRISDGACASANAVGLAKGCVHTVEENVVGKARSTIDLEPATTVLRRCPGTSIHTGLQADKREKIAFVKWQVLDFCGCDFAAESGGGGVQQLGPGAYGKRLCDSADLQRQVDCLTGPGGNRKQVGGALAITG